MIKVDRCVFVASHPRSGTHLIIDSIRRNFDSFRVKLPIYKSSANLYWNADRDQSTDAFAPPDGIFAGAGLIVQSHRAGLAFDPAERLAAKVAAAQVIYLYPFRRMSRTLRGAQELCGVAGSLAEFARGPDTLLGTGLSVRDGLERHAQTWLDRGAVFIDMDAFLSDPEGGCAALSRVLGERSRPLSRRLPWQKLRGGALAEALERMRGRESTAVRVPRLPRPCPQEAARIDEDMAQVYGRLMSRRVNDPSRLADTAARSFAFAGRGLEPFGA